MGPGHITRRLLAVVVLGLIVAACGDDDARGTDPPSTPVDQADAAPLVTTPPLDPPDGEPLASAAATELAAEHASTNEAEAFVREVRAIGDIGLLTELSDLELLAYAFDLLLREPQLTAAISVAEDAEADTDAAVASYVDAEVARLAEHGFTGAGVRDVVEAVRDGFYRLERLIDETASALDCSDDDRAFIHSDPDPDFAGYPSAPEAAEHGAAVGWQGEDLTGSAGFSHAEGDGEVWLIVDGNGRTVAEVLVGRHGEGWFASNVAYCTGSSESAPGDVPEAEPPTPSDPSDTDGQDQVHSTDAGVTALDGGRHLVFVDRVDRNGAVLWVDLAVWFVGEEANAAAIEDGETDVPVPGDFYIRNLDPTTIPISVPAFVEVFSIWFDPTDDLAEVPITYEDFVSAFDADASGTLTNMVSSPWWITIADGQVVVVQEQYVP